MDWEVLNLKELNFSKPSFDLHSSDHCFLVLRSSDTHALMVFITFELLTATCYCSHLTTASVPSKFFSLALLL